MARSPINPYLPLHLRKLSVSTLKETVQSYQRAYKTIRNEKSPGIRRTCQYLREAIDKIERELKKRR